MTKDRETADAEVVYGTAQRVWEETGEPVTDEVVAEESHIELATVRRWLDMADGVRFELSRDGEQITVTAPIR